MENKEVLEQEFENRILFYKRLSVNLTESLKFLLNESEIPYLDVYTRVKDFSSFYDKIDRKQYKKPFEQIEDICGIRVVCYYPTDINRIEQIIEKEFIVLNFEDKLDSMEPDKFGYRSQHFIIKLKRDWLSVPNYRGLGELKAEIQVRTILMHAWADISHKLSYKKKEHIPEEFQRNLFQLSALFEIADDRFDMLRSERETYVNRMIDNGEFNLKQDMNLDSLQAFLDFYFNDRVRDMKETVKLLDELILYNVSLEDLYLSYDKVKNLLPTFEDEVFKDYGEERRWHQSGIIRRILDLTNEKYWKDRYKELKLISDYDMSIILSQRERATTNNK